MSMVSTKDDNWKKTIVMEELIEVIEGGGAISKVVSLVDVCHDLDLVSEILHRKTPLSVAISLKRIDIVRLLLKSGASANAPYDMFWTTPPILAAARNDSMETTQLLLDYGARVDDMDKCGLTALVIAARRGNLALCRLLLDRGAHPEHVTDYEPLPAGLSRYVVSVVSSEEYYQRKSEPFKCNNAFIEACRYRHPDVVKEILNRRGADVLTSRTANGNTALHIAAFCETQERYVPTLDEPAKREVMPTCPLTVHVLIRRGADVHAVNDYGETPIGCLMSHLVEITTCRQQSEYVREQLAKYYSNFCLLVKAGCPLARNYSVDLSNSLRHPRKKWVSTFKILTLPYSIHNSIGEQTEDSFLDHAYVKAMEVASLSGLRLSKQDLVSLFYDRRISLGSKYFGVVDKFFKDFVLRDCYFPTLRQLCQEKVRRSIRLPLIENIFSDELGLPRFLSKCVLLEYDAVPINVPRADQDGGTNLPDYFS